VRITFAPSSERDLSLVSISRRPSKSGIVINGYLPSKYSDIFVEGVFPVITLPRSPILLTFHSPAIAKPPQVLPPSCRVLFFFHVSVMDTLKKCVHEIEYFGHVII